MKVKIPLLGPTLLEVLRATRGGVLTLRLDSLTPECGKFTAYVGDLRTSIEIEITDENTVRCTMLLDAPRV